MTISRSIVDLYAALVAPVTRGHGGSMNVLCPFHSDTTPSMKLDVEKNTARCYSCRRSWTPEQFEKELLGQEREDSLSNDKIRELVDQFEKQIMEIFTASAKKPSDYRKIFVALDKAREKSDLTYCDLAGLLQIVRDKLIE